MLEFLKYFFSWEAGAIAAFLGGIAALLAAARVYQVAIMKERRADVALQHEHDTMDDAESGRGWQSIARTLGRRCDKLEKRCDDQQAEINECTEERAALRQERTTDRAALERLAVRIAYCEKNHVDMTDSKVARLIRHVRRWEEHQAKNAAGNGDDGRDGK